jgi:predicted nuclease of restriction endonuclease-like (RecB) superfamily
MTTCKKLIEVSMPVKQISAESVRELERQIASSLYEHLALSRDKKRLNQVKRF